jgi:hypothetical protein
MPDTVVLYVTRDGHARELALDLGERLKAEVLEIGDLVNRRGLFGWIRSGKQASQLAATPIREPSLDLGAVGTVVLAQPVWASAICPPIRTWLRSNAKKLAGKRLALIASAYGTPSEVIRAKFEAEFGADIGRLAACAVVRRKDDEEARRRAVDAFVAELARA